MNKQRYAWSAAGDTYTTTRGPTAARKAQTCGTARTVGTTTLVRFFISKFFQCKILPIQMFMILHIYVYSY